MTLTNKTIETFQILLAYVVLAVAVVLIRSSLHE